ncbi:MAG: hypothetical protein ACRDQ5_02310, partial [Sciscionella sp.]
HRRPPRISQPHPKTAQPGWRLRHALGLTSAGRDRMREQAQRFAANHYDHPNAVRTFLGRVAPWLNQQSDEPQST